MSALSEQRVRRPQEHEELIQQLMAGGDGPFRSMAEVMVFAASVGYANDRRDPFNEAGEPIRYEIFSRSASAATFIDALGVLKTPGDAGILSDERLAERVAIFEEYANGGLNCIRREINASRSGVMETLLDMVRRAARGPQEGLPTELDQFFAPDFL